jgi:CheY-like chemotaxis protein
MKPVTILLAEDNLVLGLYVKRVLQQAGYRVWFCMNMAEAWQYYADKNPDLVLLDDNQPEEKNFSLATKIRTVNKVVPILFLSGKTFEDEIYRNANQFPVSQPTQTPVFNEKDILQHVHDLLPVAVLQHQTAPDYDHKKMKLSSPEDILILTTFFEDSLHMRQFVLN